MSVFVNAAHFQNVNHKIKGAGILMKTINTNTITNNSRTVKSNQLFTPNKSFLQLGFFVIITTLFALTAQAATFTVNTLTDSESNGCTLGLCTLREAVNDAGNTIGSDTINFQNGLTGTIVLNGTAITIDTNVTINGPGARNLSVSGNNASRVFVVTDPLLGSATVNMSGLTVTGGNAQPILLGGTLIGDGGGILNANGATLNLTEVTVTGNSANSLGGGIATRAVILVTTTTNITRSTINNNSSVAGGGGISNLGTTLISSATTTITNSTVSNNTALAEGGGISNTAGTTRLTNNTISNNTSTVAGGGVVNVAGVLVGTVALRNTIIAGNSAVVNTNLISSDVLGVFNSFGNNLIGNNLSATASFAASVFVAGSPTPNANADLVGNVVIANQIINANLGGLQNNGGQTNTRLPLAGSLAINNGNNCVTNNSCGSNNPPAPLTVEQRGAGSPRQIGANVDIGATEGPATQPATFTVTTLDDNETDGCAVNQCTLREAIIDANNTPDANTINFQPGLNGTITLTMGQLVVSTNITINGPGARVISVNGNAADRVFLIATPVLGGDFTANISGLTITNGSALPVGGLSGDGGGILNGALLGVISGKSTLNLTEVAILNNTATSLGGGVATRIGAETNISRSLIAANTVNAVPLIPGGDVGGGGLSNAVLSTTTVFNTTISNNTSLAAGGGILNAAGIVNSTNNTITHNQSVLLGGGVVSLVGVIPPLGVVYLGNTIIAKNDALFTTNIVTSDVLGVLGSLQSLGNNLIGSNTNAEANFTASVFVGTSPLPNTNADLVGNVVLANQIIDPLLGTLQNNGGQTNSRLPSLLSPVLNRGNNCVVTNTCANNPQGSNPPFALLTDQRGAGFLRLIDTAVEIGAIELPLAPTAANVSISGRVFSSDGRPVSRAIVSVIDSLGAAHTSVTNTFGYFKVNGITAGETVVFQVSHKQYRFDTQILTPADDITDLNIVSLTAESKSFPKIEKNDGKTGKISGNF